MEYKLCDNPWGEEEIQAINKVIDTNMYTMGPFVQQYECEFAKKFGVKHAIMVSSGSTANLISIASLLYSHRLNEGDEVIVPAVSWSTTYFPLYQHGLKLKFVDIDKDTLNVDLNALKNSITKNTKMIFLVNLLGNPNDFNEIFKIIEEKNIIVVEDNCESLGAKYDKKYTGTFGLLGTYSTFYSHHMCTMEGGVVTTNDDELYEYLLAIRAHGWTRNLPKNSMIYKKSNDSFYESYNFIVPGYNVRPLEIEGAIGIEQLKKIDNMISNRKNNAKYFLKKFANNNSFRVQKEIGESSWFGFAMVCQNDMKNKRNVVVDKLKKFNIEVRPIVAGNFTKNNAIKYMNFEIPFELVNSDDIHDNGFFVGNHSIDNAELIDYLYNVLIEK